ncbi:MAG: hypothetical protein ABFD18_06355 [Syntrophomonas sp.]
MKYIWENMTDDDKWAAVAEEMEFVTHLGTTKDDFIEIMKFLNKQNQIVKTALELACTDMALDDCCPLDTLAESEFIVKAECANCPAQLGEIHQDTERDIKCWERYYMDKAIATPKKEGGCL